MEEGANVTIMIGCDFSSWVRGISVAGHGDGPAARTRSQSQLRIGAGTGVLCRTGPAGAGRAGGQRLQPVVRGDAGGAGHRAVGGRRGADPQGRAAQAEDRPQRCAATAAAVGGGPLSTHLVPDKATRDLRQLLMHRHKLVTMRTSIANQLQAIALNRGVQRKKALWNKEGREQLKSLQLPPWTTRRRDELLTLRERWDAQIAELDKVVRRAAEGHAEARYLMRHQAGVGPITALAVVLSLGPVERFPSARKVASYAGLVPAEYSSGGKQRLGHISKEGNPFLRWLLVEAATVAVRHDRELKRVY